MYRPAPRGDLRRQNRSISDAAVRRRSAARPGRTKRVSSVEPGWRWASTPSTSGAWLKLPGTIPPRPAPGRWRCPAPAPHHLRTLCRLQLAQLALQALQRPRAAAGVQTWCAALRGHAAAAGRCPAGARVPAPAGKVRRACLRWRRYGAALQRAAGAQVQARRQSRALRRHGTAAGATGALRHHRRAGIGRTHQRGGHGRLARIQAVRRLCQTGCG